MTEETHTIFETHKVDLYIRDHVFTPATLKQISDNQIEIIFGHGKPIPLGLIISTRENGDIMLYIQTETDYEENHSEIKLINIYGEK